MKSFYGDDHGLSVGDSFRISAAIPKEWTPRIVRAPRSLHPGTTVFWDGDYFEVTEVARLDDGRYLYTLQPWSDRHAIRRFVAYDEPTETARRLHYAAALRRERWRTRLLPAAPLTGLLPRELQIRLEEELGLLAATQTLISSIVFLLLGAFSVAATVLRFFHLLGGGAPPALLLVGTLLFFDSLFRLWMLLTSSSIYGCFFFAAPYALYRALRHDTPGALLPAATLAPSDQVRLQERFHVIEPLGSLLRPSEQELLVRRFGFDAIGWGQKSAFVILLFAAAGVFSSFQNLAHAESGHLGAFISGIIALGLVVEQGLRFDALRKQQKAGSILALVVRPLFREILRTEGVEDEPTDR